MPPLRFCLLNEGVYRVLTAQDEHVGNLKRINGLWKFKAIGYTAQGELIPGGGPLTGRHNISFASFDEVLISTGLTQT